CAGGESLAAWPWGGKDLVSINGITYSPEEYRQWWQIWKEPDSKVPEEPDEFIKWKLKVQEAEIMELDQAADFKNNMEVFLNARTRMFLKYDEVDSKITVSEEELQARFNEEYNPVWHVTALYFASETEAMRAYKSVIDRQATFMELKDMAPEKGGPQQVKQGDIQPYNLPKDGVFSLIPELEEDEISAPQLEKGHFIILRLDGKKRLGADDFEAMKKSISHTLRKEKEGALTNDLLKRLWEKYEVKVDEDLTAMVIAGDVPEEVKNKPFILTNRENLPLHILMRDLAVEMKMLGNRKMGQEELEKKVNGLTRGIIYDAILNWEARARKYEEKEPFKWSYQFFRENRLKKRYEAVVMGSQVSVTDDELRNYYQANRDDFNTKGSYEYTTLTGDKSVVEKIAKEIELGQDFFVAAKKFGGQLNPKRDMNENKIEPVELEAIKGLAAGQVSQPYEKLGKLHIAKLVDIKAPEPKPFETVKNDIHKRVSRQKYRNIKKEYTERLLSQSEVSVNRRVWANLRRELQK
ncbi:MAG: peptidyl-prolyl cis-trans isomerase, partial [Desulfobulbales bacterium]|nr:peptidyl-prolyl cis-trans isomerase [Desulfobulbales bacterium]